MPKMGHSRPLPPVRVRQEPPTVEEAVIAAQALTSDLEQQVEIAAGLMDLSADAVRPYVLKAPPLRPIGRRMSDEKVSAGSRAARPVVVVERRSRPSADGTMRRGPSGRFGE